MAFLKKDLVLVNQTLKYLNYYKHCILLINSTRMNRLIRVELFLTPIYKRLVMFHFPEMGIRAILF